MVWLLKTLMEFQNFNFCFWVNFHNSVLNKIIILPKQNLLLWKVLLSRDLRFVSFCFWEIKTRFTKERFDFVFTFAKTLSHNCAVRQSMTGFSIYLCASSVIPFLSPMHYTSSEIPPPPSLYHQSRNNESFPSINLDLHS